MKKTARDGKRVAASKSWESQSSFRAASSFLRSKQTFYGDGAGKLLK